MKSLLGRKIEMTQVYDEQNRVVPVTYVEVLPSAVTQLKTNGKDGYEAIQLGYEKLGKSKKVKKSQKGKEFQVLREFRGEAGEVKVGDSFDVSMFAVGDVVRVSGVSKGKGFQGAVKRHGFSGRNATHGVKHEQRTLGSVGTSFPERVIKGRRMPGRMGSSRVTLKNVRIVKIDTEHNLVALKGALPGRRGTLMEIRV